MTGDSMATLRLEPASIVRTFDDGNITRYPESHYLDFVVDEVSFSSMVENASNVITALNRPWLHVVHEAVEVLLGRRPDTDLAQGRIPLLLCDSCGDLGCGALTASLRIDRSTVTWSNFWWEDTNEPRQAAVTHQSLTFDHAAYEAAFAGAYERVAAFPYDELAHRGRDFLWPWQWGWKIPRGPKT